MSFATRTTSVPWHRWYNYHVPLLLSLLLALARVLNPTLSIYPQSGLAPLTVRVRAVVEPDPSNRAACIQYDSGDNASISCWPLNGDHAARAETRYFTLEGGEYDFEVEVQRASAPEVTRSPRGKVVVIPRG
jgi:hypothetical protein